MSEVAIPVPSTSGAPSAAPDGPRWIAFGMVGEQQTDGRGIRWELVRVEAGGRVLHWQSSGLGRVARTEIVPGHPEYPSDAAVLAWQRDEKRRARLWWGR